MSGNRNIEREFGWLCFWLFLFSCSIVVLPLSAQAPDTIWTRHYGSGEGWDEE